MKTIGIIGYGAIGKVLAEHISNNLREYVDKVYVCEIDKNKFDEILLDDKFFVKTDSIANLITFSDLVVEAANPKVAIETLSECISKNKDIIVISVGGLLGNEDLLIKAEKQKVKVILPSGAIAGVDAIKAAKISGIDEVTITTRKPPLSLSGAPYIEQNNIDLSKIDKETIVFEGKAQEAIKGFPKNINVSAVLSLAGIGTEKTMVRIIVSPEFTTNSHEIVVKSKAGVIRTLTDNVPSPKNPKTSFLAALSVIGAIESYFKSVQIG